MKRFMYLTFVFAFGITAPLIAGGGKNKKAKQAAAKAVAPYVRQEQALTVPTHHYVFPAVPTRSFAEALRRPATPWDNGRILSKALLTDIRIGKELDFIEGKAIESVVLKSLKHLAAIRKGIALTSPVPVAKIETLDTLQSKYLAAIRSGVTLQTKKTEKTLKQLALIKKGLQEKRAQAKTDELEFAKQATTLAQQATALQTKMSQDDLLMARLEAEKARLEAEKAKIESELTIQHINRQANQSSLHALTTEKATTKDLIRTTDAYDQKKKDELNKVKATRYDIKAKNNLLPYLPSWMPYCADSDEGEEL